VRRLAPARDESIRLALGETVGADEDGDHQGQHRVRKHGGDCGRLMRLHHEGLGAKAPADKEGDEQLHRLVQRDEDVHVVLVQLVCGGERREGGARGLG
jgi:hypothetical protein